MRLNPDYVRDLLLYFEERLGNTKEVCIRSRYNEFEPDDLPCPIADAIYTSKKLIEGKLIKGEFKSFWEYELEAKVRDITWEGHKLIDNIRSQKVWDEIKLKISRVESLSIPALSKLAQQTILKVINEDVKE